MLVINVEEATGQEEECVWIAGIATGRRSEVNVSKHWKMTTGTSIAESVAGGVETLPARLYTTLSPNTDVG